MYRPLHICTKGTLHTHTTHVYTHNFKWLKKEVTSKEALSQGQWKVLDQGHSITLITCTVSPWRLKEHACLKGGITSGPGVPEAHWSREVGRAGFQLPPSASPNSSCTKGSAKKKFGNHRYYPISLFYLWGNCGSEKLKHLGSLSKPQQNQCLKKPASRSPVLCLSDQDNFWEHLHAAIYTGDFGECQYLNI